MSDSLSAAVFEAFSEDLRTNPPLSLRAGYALDAYKEAPAFVPAVDAVSDDYFECYWWGIAHLDPRSWRYYLPHLIEYALRRRHEPSMVVDALLASLRPPAREPPRLASLSARQEAVISAFLDVMAFDAKSVHQSSACTALEEWWAPGALYRPDDSRRVDARDCLPAGPRQPGKGR